MCVCVTYQNILPDLSSDDKFLEKMKGTCIQQATLRLWANLTPLFLMFFERLRFSTVLVSCHLRRLGTNVQKHVRRASAVFILSQKIHFYFHQKCMWMTLARRLHWLPSPIVGIDTWEFTRIWEKFQWKEIEWASLEPKGMSIMSHVSEF